VAIFDRVIAAWAALYCSSAIAFGAYASHGLQGQSQEWAQTAVAYLLPHGIALFFLARISPTRIHRLSLLILLAGLTLFAGSLLGAALWHWSTRFAPLGGSLLMLGWLVQAVSVLRR
jgi:uncharacterized membrane protein YgdD (TMEM256/DUF423 family)